MAGNISQVALLPTGNRSSVFTLIAAYLGLFVGLIDSNAVNLALPAIRADLGGGVSGAQWTADAYNVTFAAVLSTVGSLGDRFGRRFVLRSGLVAFVAASLACALAPSLSALLAARAAHGVGAALMLPQGLPIATATFPDAAGRARATAGFSRSTASSHLGKLTDAGMLTVRTHGRHRYYRLAGAEIADLLERLGRLAPSRTVRSLREGTTAARLRSARTCYDHFAGRLGVAIMGNLLERDVLVGGDGRYDPQRHRHDALSSPGRAVDYELTESGRAFLVDVGIELPSSRRPVVRYCIDWTEQRHHLSGGLGRGVMDRFVSAGWVKRASRGRGHSHRTRPHRARRLLRHRLDGLTTGGLH
jgi:DNA-binding transcriptional ArsR family regulator